MEDNEEKLRLIAVGNELSLSGRFYEARQHFFAARKIDAECQEIKIAELNNDALRCRRTRNYSEAVKIYQKILKISPGDVHALLSMGILTRESNPTRALTYLEKALLLQPNNAEIWMIKGWCYRDLKDIQSEFECYYTVQKIEPSIMVSQYIYGAKERLKKILMNENHKQFSQMRDYFIKVQNSEGLHHVVTENYDAALECYKEVLRLEPESVLAQNNMIDVLLKRSNKLMGLRKFEDAHQDVAQVLQISSSHDVVFRCKAQDAQINLMAEIAERAKRKKSALPTTSANDFWAFERSQSKSEKAPNADYDAITALQKLSSKRFKK